MTALADPSSADAEGRPSTGALILMPNTLDLGTGGVETPLDEVLPRSAIRVAARLGHWVAENAKSTRAFLKRVDAVVPLARPLQSIQIIELPRPVKGGPVAAGRDRRRSGGSPREAARPAAEVDALLAPAHAGHDLGLISEAGLPAVADPGAALVQAAHAASLRVVALSGPSSLMLALASSGLNGQSFAFVGYLPIEDAARAAAIRALESLSARGRQTQLMIETPYRNPALLAALLTHSQPTTRVAVACGLTLSGGFTRSETVGRWRESIASGKPISLPTDVPAVFALLAA